MSMLDGERPKTGHGKETFEIIYELKLMSLVASSNKKMLNHFLVVSFGEICVNPYLKKKTLFYVVCFE